MRALRNLNIVILDSENTKRALLHWLMYNILALKLSLKAYVNIGD